MATAFWKPITVDWSIWMKTVVIISANAEWRSVRAFFPMAAVQQSPYGEWFETELVTFFHGGWGKISAAATTQYVIDHFQPDLLVNLGTCGGFAGRIETGTIILVERAIVYDIIEQMGDADEAIAHYTTEIDLSWLDKNRLLSAVRGLMVSGDRDIVVEDIPMLIEKYGAVAADWESGPIAWVANKNRVRCLILRGVSDLVGGDGGEAYGKLELFQQRTAEIMQRLLGQLDNWIQAAGGAG
jgi:adenosylhomocysteine nucleosidase